MASKLVSHNVRAVVVVIVIAAAAALMKERAEAETHTVGSVSGWTNTVGPDFYTSWAANHSHLQVFEFTSGEHDVARLGKEAFDACNSTDLLSLPENQGPAKYSLNQTGDYYFICVFPGHCSQGQKLSIKVTATGPSATSASAPSPHSEAPTTPTAPAPNSEAPKTPSPSPSSKAETPPPFETTTPSSPPTKAATTASPPSSASSLASAISTIFMSTAIALFYLF